MMGLFEFDAVIISSTNIYFKISTFNSLLIVIVNHRYKSGFHTIQSTQSEPIKPPCGTSPASPTPDPSGLPSTGPCGPLSAATNSTESKCCNNKSSNNYSTMNSISKCESRIYPHAIIAFPYGRKQYR